MLKFFFDRFSKVVTLMEVIGILLTSLMSYQLAFYSSTLLTKILFAIFLSEYLFIRFCTTKRWHKEAKRYEGLELHFKKVMIPTSYLLAFQGVIGLTFHSTILLWLAIPILGFIVYVNATLLYLYAKDKNTTPINYYSHQKYL